MRLTLRRIRDAKGWKRKYAAKLLNMGVEHLRAIEEYRELPTFNEVIKMLRISGYYFDEIVFSVWQDISDHYVAKNKSDKPTNNQPKSEEHSTNISLTRAEIDDIECIMSAIMSTGYDREQVSIFIYLLMSQISKYPIFEERSQGYEN